MLFFWFPPSLTCPIQRAQIEFSKKEKEKKKKKEKKKGQVLHPTTELIRSVFLAKMALHGIFYRIDPIGIYKCPAFRVSHIQLDSSVSICPDY